jgi:nucleoside-diphosphate-sugar epimerase
MSKQRLQRILISGGAGFLGSHLCERLVDEGHDVICLDNFFTSQKFNVAHLLGRSNFELIRHDVTLPIFLEVDQIYHMACPAAPGHYQFNPIKTIKTSVLGSVNMLGMAKRCGARILLASTSEVYGDPTVHPQPESYWGNVNPIGIRSCYDEGKRVAETLFMDYHRMNKVDIRIVRIFNTYGPRMHPFDGRVVSNFIRQALTGNPITIFGEGEQTRSCCFRDDLVEGLYRPGQYWKPERIHNRATRCKSLGIDGEQVGHRKATFTPGRPESTAAGHFLGAEDVKLGSHDSVRCRVGEDDRLVSNDSLGRLSTADSEFRVTAHQFTRIAGERNGRIE